MMKMNNGQGKCGFQKMMRPWENMFMGVRWLRV
jgi:hypothetical protein